MKPHDPKGLIAEAYNIVGITKGECRSIFLDWALGVPAGQEALDHVRAHLKQLGPDLSDHPMTQVLQEALAPADAPRRRGGRAARV